MKTAITILQEMLVKMGETPEFECISQSGPAHASVFEVRCVARGVSVTASARSKREAKQEAARLALIQLQGPALPPPAPRHPPAAAAAAAGKPTREHVALLGDLCEEYRLGAVEYTVVGDTGPAHARQFAVSARLGAVSRVAEASTKKAARQAAAAQLYTYLREHMPRLTADYVEEEGLVRAHERAMERYEEVRDETARRPRLDQRVADYHLALGTGIDESSRAAALEALERSEVSVAAAALGLATSSPELESESGRVAALELRGSWPELVVGGRSASAAAAAAERLLRRLLRHRPDHRLEDPTGEMVY